LRISDVLQIKTEAVKTANDGRISIREQKTGKRRALRIPSELLKRMLTLSGRLYVFEHRLDWRKPRTRQAVYKDLTRVARAFRLKEVVAPHTARKVWAVEQFRKDGELQRVKTLLNHSSEAVTALYALADELTWRKMNPAKKGKGGPGRR
jgi:site-specific recombinase XerD